MRITSLGWGCVLMTSLTLMSAVTTGNNLLYLLYSALLSAMVLSLAAGRWNLARLRARGQAPEQVFRGADFLLKVVLRNEGFWPAYGVRASRGSHRPPSEVIRPGAEASFELPCRFPHRGLNRLDDLFLESAFPLGLILHRKKVGGVVGLALPRLREVHSKTEVRADARSSGRPTLRKGTGDEHYGIRDYDPSDEARIINWKLTAKTGRPLVNEFCQLQDEKVTVRLPGVGAGEAAERAIEDAASACRYYIDTGTEVRLITPEGQVDYGRGLLHLDRLLKALAALGEGKTPRCAEKPARTAPLKLADSEILRQITFLGAALVYTAVFLIDDVNPVMLAVLSPVLPLGWLLHKRGGPRLPAWVWNAMSLGVLAYVLLYGWRFLGVTVANTHLLVYLLANRVLSEVKTEELGGVFMIFLLAFFLVSGLTISPWYFVFFLLYLAFSGAWLMLASGARVEARRDWAPAYAGLLLACLGLATASFAATPRIEGLRRINPFIAAGIDRLSVKTSAMTGFTENVSLGFFGELKRSSARVMRVEPVFALNATIAGRPGTLRIRGSALDVFDGRRWSKSFAEFRYRLRDNARTSTAGRGWALRKGDQLFFPAHPADPRGPTFKFQIYPMGVSLLFTAGTPWLIEGIEDSAYFDHTDTAYVATPYIGGIRYRQYPASASQGFEADVPGGEDAVRERFLQLPGLSPEVYELARRVAARHTTDEAKARAIESYFRKGYSYSLFSDSKERTLEDFLFKTMRGNCEYFASAGAVLLRAAGIPSRLVTGFLADDWNEYGKFYDVRQREAHAWVEAYIPGKGWMTFDPTPAEEGGFSARANAVSRKLERWFNAFQAEWYRHVIGYDQFIQSNTFNRMGVWINASALLNLSEWVVGLAVFAVVLVAGGRRLSRLRRSLVAVRSGCYIQAQSALERAGLQREPWLTPREYAGRVKARRPDLAAVEPLAELHYRQFYSPRGLSPEEEDRARRLFSELRSRL